MKTILPALLFFLAVGFTQTSEAKGFFSIGGNTADPVDTTENCDDYFSWESIKHLTCYAEDFIGIPYHYGSAGIKSFDCSGFTSYVFKQFGLLLPRSSRDQGGLGRKVHMCDARKGDLVFFKGRKSSGVGHVGIVISDLGGQLTFIHASVSKGVTIDNIDSKYYKDRFLFVKRVIE